MRGTPDDYWSLMCPRCENSWHGGPDDWSTVLRYLVNNAKVPKCPGCGGMMIRGGVDTPQMDGALMHCPHCRATINWQEGYIVG